MNRVAFGKPLAAQGTIQADIAQSRIEIEQTRLMVLKAAHMMDLYGNKVSDVKVQVKEHFLILFVLRQTGLRKQCRPRSDATKCGI